MAALFWFLNKTRTGKSMRAYSDNRDLALLSGIKPDKVVMVAWILTARWPPSPVCSMASTRASSRSPICSCCLPMFAAAIVGGLGNPLGAIAGGFIVALSEVFITFAYTRFLALILPEGWAPDGLVQFLSTDYKFAVSFAILVIVLLVRPTGIFRGQSV
jgi:branched-chain amino acid transport system permease protein